MLKNFLKNSVKGDKNAIAEKAIGLQAEQMAVQMQKILQQRGWVQKQDRGSVEKLGGRTAGLRGIGVDRSRLSGRQKQSERGK